MINLDKSSFYEFSSASFKLLSSNVDLYLEDQSIIIQNITTSKFGWLKFDYHKQIIEADLTQFTILIELELT